MTSPILDDDDELRSRWIQAAGQISLPPIQITPPVPTGLSPLSSIGKAEESDAVPLHRPHLPEPRVHSMVRLAKLQQMMESSYAKSSRLLEMDIEQNENEIRRLDLERSQALRAEIEATKSRDTWQTLGMIAEYAGSAAIAAVGWSTGGVGGALMVAAGVIGLGNRVIHDTHLIDPAVAWLQKSEEKQQRLKANIEMGAFFLQLGFGLAGGVTAWRAASQGATALAMLRGTNESLMRASLLGGVTANVGKAVYQRRIENAHADRSEINANITLANQNKSDEVSRMSTMLEQSRQINEAIHRVIGDSQVEAG